MLEVILRWCNALSLIRSFWVHNIFLFFWCVCCQFPGLETWTLSIKNFDFNDRITGFITRSHVTIIYTLSGLERFMKVYFCKINSHFCCFHLNSFFFFLLLIKSKMYVTKYLLIIMANIDWNFIWNVPPKRLYILKHRGFSQHPGIFMLVLCSNQISQMLMLIKTGTKIAAYLKLYWEILESRQNDLIG